MSYAIAEVIWGKPITEDTFQKIIEEVKIEQLPRKFLEQLDLNRTIEDADIKDVVDALRDDESLFETRYSASNETPRFLGVSLCKFMEGNHIELGDLQLSPTPTQYITAYEKLQAMPEALQPYFGPLKVYIFWSTG